MKKLFFYFISFLLIFLVSFVFVPEAKNTLSRKKILIVTSRGGGGHISASNALESYLKDRFDIKIVKLLEEVLSPIDAFQDLTFGKYSYEDLYNYFLKERLTFFINIVASKSNWYISSFSKSIENLIKQYFLKENPDIIISVIPLFNQQLLNVSKELNIPLILVTVDLDTINYVRNFNNITYDKFFYTIVFDDDLIKDKLKNLNLNSSQLKVVGFPIRKDFFEVKDMNLIKKEFSLPFNKQIIMILMGATGSCASINYLKEISKINLDAHIIICTGRDDNLKDKLKKVNLSENLTLSIIGFTDRISDLMAVSDCIITKPGPTSISEALYLNKPIIVDYTCSPVFWEKLNIDFIQKHNFGFIISCLSDLKIFLPKILDKKYNSKIVNRIKSFEKRSPIDEISNLINHLILL